MTCEITLQEALIYTRVAALKQRSGDVKLEEQFHRCLSYAEEAGFDVRASFTDVGGSGIATTWGPGMLSMLQYINERRSMRFVIIVDDLSRLTRNRDRYLTLKCELRDVGAEIHTAQQGLDSDPKVIEHLMAAIESQRRRSRE